MPSQEEILLRLGIDANSLNAGTMTVLDRQKKAALDYSDFWRKAISERERAETIAAERRIAREKATAEIVARNTAESLAKGQAAVSASQAAIAAGSIPASMAGGAVKKAEQQVLSRWKQAGYDIVGGAITGGSMAGGYAGAQYLMKGGKVIGKLGADGELEKAAEGAIKSVAEMGEAAHGNATAMREGMVMVREGLRGAYSRMLSSFSIWFGAMWRPIGKIAASIERIPIVGKLFGPARVIFV